MKKLKNCFLLALATVGFAACVETDNYAGIKIVDNGTVPFPSFYKDSLVSPGDNFFQYYTGGFNDIYICPDGEALNKTYLSTVVNPIHTDRIDNLPVPSADVIARHLGYAVSGESKARAVLQQAINTLNSAKTLEEAYEITGQLMAQGAAAGVNFSVVAVDGVINHYVALTDNTLVNLVRNLWRQEVNDPEFVRSLRPLAGVNRRAYAQSEWPMLNGWCKGFGLDPTRVLLYDEAMIKSGSANPDNLAKITKVVEGLKEIQNMSLEAYKQAVASEILNDTAFVSRSAFNGAAKEVAPDLSPSEIANLNYDNLDYLLKQEFCAYELSKVVTETYITPELRQTVTDRCLEIRKTFADRVQRNTWMSDATKSNVLEKLNAMKINVGGPENWYQEGLADLSQSDNIMSDIYLLRKAKNDLLRTFSGKPMDEVSFHILAGSFNNGLAELNAFYMPNYNSMNILPAFCLPPLFDPSYNEAALYACCITYGHEITHGFDSEGAKMGKNGNYAPLWANEADAAKFKQLSNALADYYSSLEIIPGLYNDGYFTLAENIADLGGIEIAYEAYCNYLKSHGFTGEEMDKQKRLFFQCYAQHYAESFNREYALMVTNGIGPDKLNKDTHSMFKERVNGLVVHMDDWYRLYDVKESDKMYLPADKRIHIW